MTQADHPQTVEGRPAPTREEFIALIDRAAALIAIEHCLDSLSTDTREDEQP